MAMNGAIALHIWLDLHQAPNTDQRQAWLRLLSTFGLREQTSPRKRPVVGVQFSPCRTTTIQLLRIIGRYRDTSVGLRVLLGVGDHMVDGVAVQVGEPVRVTVGVAVKDAVGVEIHGTLP